MPPACLFAAVALAVPTPMQMIEAHALVREPYVQSAEPDHRALKIVGARLELIGTGEHYYHPDEDSAIGGPDAAAMLVLLSDLYAELRDAPPLADADRLPPAAVCHDAASANGRAADYFRLRLLWEPDREDTLAAAVAECEAYQEFWLTAAFAAGGYSVADRRRSLSYIRGRVGRDNWAAGRLPDFVPSHLFNAR